MSLPICGVKFRLEKLPSPRSGGRSRCQAGPRVTEPRAPPAPSDLGEHELWGLTSCLQTQTRPGICRHGAAPQSCSRPCKASSSGLGPDACGTLGGTEPHVHLVNKPSIGFSSPCLPEAGALASAEDPWVLLFGFCLGPEVPVPPSGGWLEPCRVQLAGGTGSMKSAGSPVLPGNLLIMEGRTGLATTGGPRSPSHAVLPAEGQQDWPAGLRSALL